MGNVIFKDNISYEEYNKLFKSVYFVFCDKDYMTNLQEENEDLKDRLKVMEHFKNSLLEENERLTRFKYNIPNDKTQSVPTITKSYKREYEDYKSRCEKAIEYIEDNTYKSYETDYMDLTGIKELLNILNVSDKEN